jgi:hypothetical protein
MSDAIDWTSRKVESFKKDFGVHKNKQAGFFRWQSVPPELSEDATRFNKDAEDLLSKRQRDAQAAYAAVLSLQTVNAQAYKAKLLLEQFELEKATIARPRPGSKAEKAERDAATEKVLALTERWRIFEENCIAARNEINDADKGSGIGPKLDKRVDDMLAFLQGHTLGTNLSPKLTGERNALVAKVNEQKQALVGATPDYADVSRELEGCKRRCEALVKAAGASPGASPDLHKDALKSLFGVTVQALQPKAPLAEILEAFAMVPSDHAITRMLRNVAFEDFAQEPGSTFRTLGDYSAGGRKVRVNANISPAEMQTYYDPDSDRPVSVKMLQMTTLHEIGHAVDHAYGIMDSCIDKPGCGQWRTVDPLDLVKSDYDTFIKQLEAMFTDPAIAPDIGATWYKGEFVDFMTGKRSSADLEKALAARWTDLLADVKNNDKLKKIEEDSTNEEIQLDETLGVLREKSHESMANAGSKDDWPTFEQSRQAEIQAIAAFEADFAAELKAAYETNDWSQVLALVLSVKTQALEDIKSRREAAQDRAKATENRFAVTYAKAAVLKLPKDATLDQSIASRSPWENLSQEKIAGDRAAHQSDSKWWSYSLAERESTSVRNYQWRAPGEWFAELYAYSWFRKEEPPAAIGADIRSYLYGGHVAA